MQDAELTIDEIHRASLEAEPRIRPWVRETPLEPSPWLSRLGHCEVHLKLENLQVTGSFKLRGAANRLLTLSSEEKRNGIVTASTGNHGSAVAYLLRELDLTGTIYAPKTISAAKLAALERLEADIELFGNDGVEAEIRAREVARQSHRFYVSPYNDRQIIAGQGTVGLEIDRQLAEVEIVVVPVGGGGLIAGIAGVLESIHPGIEIVGCGIESEAMTFKVCQRSVDRFVLVSEEEIRQAIRHILEKHHLLIEGAAALSVAAFLQHRDRFAGKRIVLVISGAKISLETLRQVLE
jgi:threonine dehydratase